VTVPLDDKAFRFYDVRTDTWEVESGAYEIYVGASVADIRLQTTVEVQGTLAEGPYNKNEFSHYFNGEITSIDDAEFELLYGAPIPDGSWSGEIQINDAVCQLYYGKSLIGKGLCAVLKKMIADSEKKGAPSLNALFIYNMPIRGFARMTGGAVNIRMAEAMVEFFNGHRLKGLGHLIKACFKY
jgi:beta-glucosidase